MIKLKSLIFLINTIGKEQGFSYFPSDLSDERKLWDKVNDVITNPIIGLSDILAKYKCRYERYIYIDEPPETSLVDIWEPQIDEDGEEVYHEEDIITVEKEHEYYLIKDSYNREICRIELAPDSISMDGSCYITEVKYLGPEDEESQWKPMLEQIDMLRCE